MAKKNAKDRQVRMRYFRIWQRFGYNPFKKEETDLAPVTCSSCGHTFDTPYCPHCGQPHQTAGVGKKFFKGAFDSIPFLNDDAKRTLSHLLLRPGYMIRDYLNGLNSRYLSPMTALIIFYAFFALVTSILAPVIKENDYSMEERGMVEVNSDIEFEEGMEVVGKKIMSAAAIINKVDILLNLDRFPDAADTPAKKSLAAVEGALRSQGLMTFMWQLIVLTLTLFLVLRRRYGVTFSASATISAYVLCQFCFFMLLTLLMTFGKSHRLGAMLMGIILTLDFHQLFDLPVRQSLRLVIRVGLVFVAVLIMAALLMIGLFSLVL